MDGSTIQDRRSRAWGLVARYIGQQYIVYKPNGSANPVASRNRVIKLTARFTPGNAGAPGVLGYGGVLWRGTFDSLYTKPGYYLVDNDATFFVASQWSLQPIQCIRTTDTITIARTQMTPPGAYSGFVSELAQQIIVSWPACLMANSTHIGGGLPEASFGNWTAYLPVLPAQPQVADVVTDLQGRFFVVSSAQLSSLGWRLTMRQIDG
jgi:hypothetical protein